MSGPQQSLGTGSAPGVELRAPRSLFREGGEGFHVARILVIDDDGDVRTVLREILEAVGHDVLEAANGDAGIRLCHEGPVDLVTTNIVMPEKDGLETIKELRHDFPDVRIVAISGYDKGDRLGYLSLAEEYGAQRTFTKPFRREDIVEAVHDLLTGDGRTEGGQD